MQLSTASNLNITLQFEKRTFLFSGFARRQRRRHFVFVSGLGSRRFHRNRRCRRRSRARSRLRTVATSTCRKASGCQKAKSLQTKSKKIKVLTNLFETKLYFKFQLFVIRIQTLIFRINLSIFFILKI